MSEVGTATNALHAQVRDNVLTLTLSRPEKRNALSADLVEALIEQVDAAPARGISVIVLQGKGKNFSAGFDFTGWRDASEGDLVLRFLRLEILFQKLIASPVLTVGRAHGRNFGAGVDLLANCRRRVVSRDATFRMPGLQFGLVLGTRRFAEIVGQDAAHQILSDSSTFDAQEAHQLGFATAVLDTTDGGSPGHDRSPSWPPLQQSDPMVQATLNSILGTTAADADLAAVARSAAEPGLKARIARYLGDPI